MPDYGIDVSGYNTITNWAAARSVGNSWMWSKATQGGDYTNPLFTSQISGARAAGLLVGAYHFPDPNVSVATNVAHFAAAAGAQHTLDRGCFVPMLDMEDDPADGIVWTAASANAFVREFRDQFRAATGVHELCVYGSEYWYATGKLDPNQWVDDGVTLCVAQYTGVPGKVDWTHPRAAVHQYTSSAPTPGATAVTDRSVTLGSWTAQQLTIGGGVSPATITPGDTMFEFIGNGDTLQDTTKPVSHDNGLNKVVLLVGGGKVLPATWGDVCAKDQKFGGDGTGSVLGVAAAAYQAYLDTDKATRAAEQALAALTPAAIAQAVASALPASAGGTAAPTYDIATEPGGVVIAKAIPEKP